MFWFVLLGLYASCCSPGGTASKSAGDYRASFEEDLSVYRNTQDFVSSGSEEADEEEFDAEASGRTPEGRIKNTTVPAAAAQQVNYQLDTLLSNVARKNEAVRTISGFTILVYTGTSRDGANQAKRRVYNVIPDAQPELKYIQPNYKVQVGEFIDRLEAQRVFAQLKNEFPSALIVPERIRIN